MSAQRQWQVNGHVEVSRFLAEFYRKCCAFLNKEMLFYEVFIQKIQVQSSIISSSVLLAQQIFLYFFLSFSIFSYLFIYLFLI